MKAVLSLITVFLLSFSIIGATEEAENEMASGYISDNLFVYMHAGAGNNYRILGSVDAGSEIKLTGEQENNFTQLIDTKGRTGWVESRYVSATPGLRSTVNELNQKLSTNAETERQLSQELNQAKQTINQLEQQNSQLSANVEQLKQSLAETKSQIENQDIDSKKEWFFNGAIVLIIGLLLGIVLPHLAAKRRKVDNWR